jgi:hypothetical protein
VGDLGMLGEQKDEGSNPCQGHMSESNRETKKGNGSKVRLQVVNLFLGTKYFTVAKKQNGATVGGKGNIVACRRSWVNMLERT